MEELKKLCNACKEEKDIIEIEKDDQGELELVHDEEIPLSKKGKS